MPTPGVLAGALSRRTKRAKIAVLGRALPCSTIRSASRGIRHPRQHYRGRFIAGFVRGIGVEYHSTRFESGQVARALPRGARPDRAGLDPDRAFAFEGKHYQFQYVNLWPRPYQHRIRRSGFRRKAPPRPSNGPRTRTANIRTCKRSARCRRSSASTPSTWKPPSAMAMRHRPISSAGRCRSTCPTPTNRPIVSEAAHRGDVQQVPAHAFGVSAATRLYISLVDEKAAAGEGILHLRCAAELR